MAATQIAQNLAFINWTVLTGLALGTFGAVALLRWRTSATGGYLGFVTACAVAFGVLAWLSDGALPRSLGDSPVVVDPTFDGPRRAALIVFVVLAAGGLVVRRFRPKVGRAADVGAVIAGGATIVAGAQAWGGSAMGTAALGHWYLVTPKLPEAPLILLARVLLGVMALQVGLFVAWLATGAGPAHAAPFSALTGQWALFVWLRLIVGLVFPLVVSWAAVQTARTRSMGSRPGRSLRPGSTSAPGCWSRTGQRRR